MEILISTNQPHHKIPLKQMETQIQAVLNALAYPDAELSVNIVDDLEIAKYNQQYLNRQGPTNVIAFPMCEGEFSHITPTLLGDVLISTETAHREARTLGFTFEDRMLQLLIHGILHLLGYDHETSEQDAERMEAKSEALFELVKNQI